MALQLIFLIASTYMPLTIAELNFWGNEICYSESDCSGLTHCDLTFGCLPSIWKIAVIAFSVVLFIALACVACFYLGFCGVVMMYRRNRSNNRNVINPVIVQHTPPQNPVLGANVAYTPSAPYLTNVPYPTNSQYPSSVSYPRQNTQNNQQQFDDPDTQHHQSYIGFKQELQFQNAPFKE